MTDQDQESKTEKIIFESISVENGVLGPNSQRSGLTNQGYLNLQNSPRKGDSRSRRRFNPFRDPSNLIKRRLSKEHGNSFNTTPNEHKPPSKSPNSRRMLTIEDAKKINESLKNDLANFERPKINQVRNTVGNDNRRIESISVATKISVSRKLSPKFRYLRDSGLEQGGTQSFKGNMPGSFFKNLKSSSNLKLLTPKSSIKEFKISTPASQNMRKINLSEMNIIKWEGDDWPDIEAELSFGKCLGQGSFAKVFQGIDKKLKKHVAIKVVDKAKLDDDKRQKLAQKEINILSSINHKNLCKFYRLLEDHKRVKK